MIKNPPLVFFDRDDAEWFLNFHRKAYDEINEFKPRFHAILNFHKHRRSNLPQPGGCLSLMFWGVGPHVTGCLIWLFFQLGRLVQLAILGFIILVIFSLAIITRNIAIFGMAMLISLAFIIPFLLIWLADENEFRIYSLDAFIKKFSSLKMTEYSEEFVINAVPIGYRKVSLQTSRGKYVISGDNFSEWVKHDSTRNIYVLRDTFKIMGLCRTVYTPSEAVEYYTTYR